MAIEMEGPGISGFGYGSQGQSGAKAEDDQSTQQSGEASVATKAAGPAGQSGGAQTADNGRTGGGHAEGDAEEVAALELGYDHVPGFEMSASNCVNRARQIARSLNHATFSSDHLMLALTMDPGARRQLERVGDVDQLRAFAMRRLGKNYNKSDSADQMPVPTSDLADIGKKAREAAAEREQLVSISDLIGAFPKENGRLTYGAGESSRAVAVMETIETRVIPGLNDAMRRIENAIFEAVQRQQQTVQSVLADLNSRHSLDWERKQREFVDEIRRQVREAADMQFAAALKELNATFEKKLAEAKEENPAPSPQPDVHAPAQAQPSKAPETKSSWNWLSLIL
ncbi:MAG TPA: Clp protease N-terminal domain-containing protein [Methyloceanibacter sp.]|nr:Clp protease N-terminal domain-containing protein [Methyloceanibacter sp.]